MDPVILVTGATGFIGRRLCEHADRAGLPVRRALRQAGGHEGVVVGELQPDTDWRPALQGVDAVIHLAARVHVLHEAALDPPAEFQRVNVAGTLNLARQAAAAGVRRFIFISSIKVNGEMTEPGAPFREADPPAAKDAYALSKWEAEEKLFELAGKTGLEVVIIRPPLVYGPGVKANFLAMMRWLHRGLPLPFGAVRNQRSLVAADNLVDLLVTCLDHPAAANQLFLAGDGEDLSTAELLRRLGEALGKPARLLPVPGWLLETGAAALGRRDLARRLCGSLQVDIGKARTLLGWKPPVQVEDGLRATARHYLETLAR